MRRLLIGAATSNSGKTTFCTGLLRALRNRKLKVQPYKCGPDYIDTQIHAIASGNTSINLDTFMASEAHVKEVFERYGKAADVKVVEGVMGLFDGSKKRQGSSADLGILLDLPVVLVVNAQSVAYSVAPLIYGFKHFDPRLKIGGVVFNKVASARHYQFLQEACEDAGCECLGCLQRNDQLQLPSRHLGLSVAEELKIDEFAEAAAAEVEAHVNIDRLLAI